ncbi:TetR/AcrR family transcriptional regulator [Pseudonocardia sp. C8]|uniref:TetR/AcrR family transcriptional regulator n=1 Tax=Pseudonocardia sp. C8 TaxID=2762759 RepID=UPI0016424789|nr:TetR/AcrR family transcriptional regulator [Pseudonocardia sp. C8]MBC3194706.1 TetR/AcrR family transcriptional regulator [Pseudonocardia sp. C8]
MEPVKSRRTEYTETTRDAVLDSAAELFIRRGYPKTSLDEVAAAARVTKGAIYHHFSNKAALMKALIERLEQRGNDRIRQTFLQVREEHGAAAGALAAIDAFLDQCAEPVYSGLVFREAPLALGWQEWRACEERYAVAVIEEILRVLADDGVIPRPLMTPTLVSVVFGMLGTAGQEMAGAGEADRPRVRSELQATFGALLSGLLTAGPGA